MPSVYFTPDEMCTTVKLEMSRAQAYFLANGWNVAAEPSQADLILCLTCSGWDKLEENSLRTLADMQRYAGRVVSIGCANNVNPEGVAGVHAGECIGTLNLEDMAGLIPNPAVPLSEVPAQSVFRTKEDYRLYDLTKRFVNIAMGCSFKCTYCPHRIGLGPLRSRTEEDILGQVRELAQGDLRILVLTGMETACYGLDIGSSISALLRKVLEEPGSFDIHIAQFNPIGVTKQYDSLLELFSNTRVTDIQMPIQTTSARLLKMMGRPPLHAELGAFLEHVRTHNPRGVLRTDLIVGFPTETLEELDASIEFAARHFDEVAAYGIEIRKGLPAERYLPDALSEEDLAARVGHAMKKIEALGAMAHGGQQDDIPLEEIELRKQAIRQKHGAC